ncbi:hypothetical protein HDU97_007551 [Phlyctochytrium planicorne]|nr:hypothetical protein HDU97_007551 [Phlyctochytrium planicorne]
MAVAIPDQAVDLPAPGSASTPPCAHDPCRQGAALDPTCDPCVAKITTILSLLVSASASVMAVAVPVDNDINIDRRGGYYTASPSPTVTFICGESVGDGRCRDPAAVQRRGYYTPSPSPTSAQCMELDVNGRCQDTLHRRGYYTPSPSPTSAQCVELDVNGRCRDTLHRRGYYTAAPSPTTTDDRLNKERRGAYYTTAPEETNMLDVAKKERRGAYYTPAPSTTDLSWSLRPEMYSSSAAQATP